MKTFGLLFLTAFILALFPAHAQEDQETDFSFSFRLVSTPGYIELQSENGCNWLTLSFSLWQNGDPVFINENGMLGANPNMVDEYKEQSRFLVKIGRIDNKLIITAHKGTSWQEYEDSCLDEYCSIQVDQQSPYPY